jgi:transcriptional regulator with XRE-family HTH domain
MTLSSASNLETVEYLDSLEITDKKLAQNAIAFGKFLRQWRVKMGWTQYTANRYGQELGFSTISYGNLSVLERGIGGELRIKAFYQLARLNFSLHIKEYKNKLFTDQVIRCLIEQHGVVSICTPEGLAWGPMEFWGAANGFIDFPWDVNSEPLTVSSTGWGSITSAREAYLRLSESRFCFEPATDAIVFLGKQITAREQEAVRFLVDNNHNSFNEHHD